MDVVSTGECLSNGLDKSRNGSQAPVGNWSFRATNLDLKPEQLLPQDYIERIQQNFGPLKLRIIQDPEFISVNITAGGHHIESFTLLPDPQYPGSVIAENLRLENPLNTGSPRLHLSQKRKGLPLPVFRFALDRIFEVARAGGFRYLAAEGSQNYTVYTLYRKVLDMHPSHPEGIRLARALDDLYRFSRKALPEPYRPRDMDDFARSLGDFHNLSISPDTLSRIQAYWRTGALPPGLELIQRNGDTIGFIDTRPMPAGSPHVFFLYPGKGKTILQWRQFNYSRGIRLHLDLHSSP